MASVPFRLEQALPIVRDTGGKFREMSRATPRNPLDQSEAGQQPERWAPGIGQGTAPLTGQSNPYPPITPVRPPMKLGG